MTILEYLKTVTESPSGSTTIVAMQNVTEFVLIPKSDVTISIEQPTIDCNLIVNNINADLKKDIFSAIITQDIINADFIADNIQGGLGCQIQ